MSQIPIGWLILRRVWLQQANDDRWFTSHQPLYSYEKDYGKYFELYSEHWLIECVQYN